MQVSSDPASTLGAANKIWKISFPQSSGEPKALGKLLKLRSHPGGGAQLPKKSAHPDTQHPPQPPPCPLILWTKPLLTDSSVAAFACLCFCSGCRQPLTLERPRFHLGQTLPPGSPQGSSKPPVKVVPPSLARDFLVVSVRPPISQWAPASPPESTRGLFKLSFVGLTTTLK